MLLQKLKDYGIDTIFLEWFQQYVHGRWYTSVRSGPQQLTYRPWWRYQVETFSVLPMHVW